LRPPASAGATYGDARPGVSDFVGRAVRGGGPGMKTVALQLIRFYQRFISPAFPPSCRFTPTCSQYSYEAINRYGLRRGIWLSLRRLTRCHPFHPGGYDPVP